MNELEYEWCRNLQLSLKERIKGGVYCAIYDDVLNIQIVILNKFEFRYKLDDMSRRFLYGIDKEKLVNDILKTLNTVVRKAYLVN